MFTLVLLVQFAVKPTLLGAVLPLGVTVKVTAVPPACLSTQVKLAEPFESYEHEEPLAVGEIVKVPFFTNAAPETFVVQTLG